LREKKSSPARAKIDPTWLGAIPIVDSTKKYHFFKANLEQLKIREIEPIFVDSAAIQAKRRSINKSVRRTFPRATKNHAELFSVRTVEAFAGRITRASKRSDKRLWLAQANAQI
jgi:hypothetical protein